MTDMNLTNLPAVCRSLENQQEKIMQKITELGAALQSEKKWGGEIGDHLVYLKYYATSSFFTEKEIMKQHGFSAFHAHKEQHDAITEELRRLLEQVVASNASVSLITDASHRLMNILRKHISQHDSELFAFMDKNRQQAAPVQHKETTHYAFPAFMDMNCYTA